MSDYEPLIARWVESARQHRGNQLLPFILQSLQGVDGYTDGHTHRVARYSLILASGLLVDSRLTYEAVAIHDIGKVIIPQSLILKPGPLTPFEYAIVQQHPEIGLRMIEPFDELRAAADVIASHHERWDGQGYPRGLRGEEIPTVARILSVADAFDAMTTDRPYRQAWTLEAARAEVVACAGTQFDPEVVRAFLEAFPRICAQAIGIEAA